MYALLRAHTHRLPHCSETRFHPFDHLSLLRLRAVRNRMTVGAALAGAERIGDGNRGARRVAKVHREEGVRWEGGNQWLIGGGRQLIGLNFDRFVGGDVDWLIGGGGDVGGNLIGQQLRLIGGGDVGDNGLVSWVGENVELIQKWLTLCNKTCVEQIIDELIEVKLYQD